MNVLTDNIFGVYRKYLVAAFGSALYAVRRGARVSTAPANRYFTAALLMGIALSAASAIWASSARVSRR